MICPKCKNDMEAIEFEGVEVDRCRNCKGIWFDAGESDWLRDNVAAAVIDSGDPLKGKQTNEIDRYPYPRCGGGMMRRVYPQQSHLRYEECTSCRGSFFDAGEFTDVVQDRISQFLWEVTTPKQL